MKENADPDHTSNVQNTEDELLLFIRRNLKVV